MGLSAIIARPSGSRDDLAALPTLPNGVYPGDCVLVFNRGTAELTLQSESVLSGSKLNLKADVVTLQPYDALQITWDGSAWYETGRSFAPSTTLNAADYGLRETNTGSENASALASAITAAVASGKEILIPEGTFDINQHALVTQAGYSLPASVLIPAGASVAMRGADMSRTILRCSGYVEATYHGPVLGVGYVKDTLNDDATAMFTTPVAGASLTLTDLTLQGPSSTSLTMDQNNAWGIYHAGGGSLTLRRVGFTLWNQDIKLSPNSPSYPGTGTTMWASECSFRWRGLAILGGGFSPRLNYNTQTANFTVGAVLTGGTSGAKAVIIGDTDAGATGTLVLRNVAGTFVTGETITDGSGGSAKANGTTYAGGASVNLMRCRFEYHSELTALLYSTEGGQSNGANHGCYISNGCSFRTIGNDFIATGGPAGCAWRHYSVGDVDVPEYSESIGDYFASASRAAIITNPNFVSHITQATVHTKYAEIGVKLAGPARISDSHFIGEQGASYGITDAGFVSGQLSISNCIFEGDYTYAIGRLLDTAARWMIGPNVEFSCKSSLGGGALRLLGGGIDLDDVVFNVTGAGGAAFINGGSVRMRNTRFTSATAYLVINPSSADVTMEFGPGVVDESATGSFYYVVDAHNLSMKGIAPMFTESSGQGIGFTMSGSVASTLTGQLQCNRGVGAYNYASNVLTVNWNYDTYSINEGSTPAINNVYMKGGITGGAAVADQNKSGAARIHLRVQQAFTLGTSGNIVPASNVGAQASGTVTISSGSGTITATINSVGVAVTWGTDDATTAAALAAAINASTNSAVQGQVYATAAAGVVTIKARTGGSGGNAITLAASGTGATASGATLTGGGVRVVDSMIALQWVPAAAKWYELSA